MGITAECKHCLQKYDAKRSTSLFCSPQCKQAFYRNRIKPVTVTPVTLKPKSVTVTLTVTNPCKYCGKQLDFAILECCYKCALEQPSKASSVLASRPALEFTGKMTVMERLFYRPAHLLKPGQTNFISLPGRACYGVV
jgi:hypothetical protein